MLYFVTQENIQEKDRRMLLQVASIPSEYEAAIINLSFLGATLQSDKKTKLSKLASVFKKSNKAKPSGNVKEVTYDLSRYTPKLKDVLTDFFNNSLNSSEYSTKDTTGVASSTPMSVDSRPKSSIASWHQSAGPSGSTSPKLTEGPKLIVFVVGGVTYSEMRAAAEIAKQVNREIIIGSTDVLIPESYIENVRVCDDLSLVIFHT